ncbi:hypothetical protein D9M68_448090 [compost metagenome]
MLAIRLHELENLLKLISGDVGEFVAEACDSGDQRPDGQRVVEEGELALELGTEKVLEAFDGLIGRFGVVHDGVDAPGPRNGKPLSIPVPHLAVVEVGVDVCLVVVRDAGRIDRLQLVQLFVQLVVAVGVLSKIKAYAPAHQLGGHVILVAHNAGVDVDSVLLDPVRGFALQRVAFPSHDVQPSTHCRFGIGNPATQGGTSSCGCGP